MNKLSKNLKAYAPLFDRLIDVDPQSSQEAPPLRTYGRKELQSSIQKELESLLNTRPNIKRLESFPNDYSDILGTTLFYGAHNFSSLDITSAQGKEDVRLSLMQAIQHFEPRLQDISVQIVRFEKNTQCLYVIINGTVTMGNIRESWSFPITVTDVEITKSQEVLAG